MPFLILLGEGSADGARITSLQYRESEGRMQERMVFKFSHIPWSKQLKTFSLTLLALGIIAWGVPLIGLLRVLGLVQTKNIQALRRAMKSNEGVLILHRHPSKWESWILPLLALSFRSVFSPLRETPRVTPDRRLFYDAWWAFWWRPFAFPVNRQTAWGQREALREIRGALRAGNKILLAPEGGRTFGTTSKERVFKGWGVHGPLTIRLSEEDFRAMSKRREPFIRRFQEGSAFLARGITLVPVWVEVNRHHIVVRCGAPLCLASWVTLQQAREELENTILSLAFLDS